MMCSKLIYLLYGRVMDTLGSEMSIDKTLEVGESEDHPRSEAD